MHIPDGFLNTGVSVVTGVAAAGAVGYGLHKAREELDERSVPMLALCAAFIFAAQMLNFPIAGGTSGHFLGGALAAVLLGPWLGGLVIALVLLVQCLGFADGGLTALGANIFNMALIGTILIYYVFYGLKSLLPRGRTYFLAATGFSAWLSVVLASGACAIQLAISGTSPLSVALPAMLGIHALIGIVEGAITVLVVGVVLAVRPDLVRTHDYRPVAASYSEAEVSR
ncbi:MAG: energy-coupling factor ABC transporter permease [Actinobacteria bacterium]|nr:energy-coupling factor ABC transporter permease [Actinomycetota bacterium]MDI6830532.1 energy-coupling factor ABC transporter permease [Actinomycetota bacterium]